MRRAVISKWMQQPLGACVRMVLLASCPKFHLNYPEDKKIKMK
ncbi:hypothetical protein SLEP1_g28507 [Rubroshorea leprosula]|uniref:Uncharacterized protein n=1 Tax=Rubroshorea leprosula TaxID=152421 RepID=A0AAV5JZK4_9ROSI|nr:hypothetical protein SLEP1_g28507 [Rubroshorea leprosula]